MRKNRLVFLALAIMFILVSMPVILFDPNLIILGDGLWISKGFITFIFTSLLLLWFTLIILFYLVFTRAYSVTFKDEVCGSPPFDYSPAIMKMLNNSKSVSSHEIIAIISYFYNRKYVNIDVKFQDASCFTIYKTIDNLSADTLTSHEKYLLHWLFGEMGDGNNISLSELETYTKNNKSAFEKSYDEFIVKLKSDTEKHGFFFKYRQLRLFGKMIGVFFTVSSIALAYLFDKPVFFLFFFLGLIFFYYCNNITKRTQKGQIHFEKWMAYKRYLTAELLNPEKDIDIGSLSEDLPYIMSLGLFKDLVRNAQLNNTGQPEAEPAFNSEILLFKKIYDLIVDTDR